MSQFNTEELLASLEGEVNNFFHQMTLVRSLDAQTLNTQPGTDKWSIAQVLEHLNSYNRYYLYHMEKAINEAGKAARTPAITFSPGIIGNYFTRIMYSDVVTKSQVTNKMNAPKDHRPIANLDAAKVIAEFLKGEEKLLELIGRARRVNMAKIKVPISISPFIKISLGDTLRFMIAHQVRHFLQIRNTVAAVTANHKAVA